MDQIIAAGAKTVKLENDSIYRLYCVSENYYNDAYNMYMNGDLVESFILFLRFTKLFEMINLHNNRFILLKRYNSIKKNFRKSIMYMEDIKPKLEKKI